MTIDDHGHLIPGVGYVPGVRSNFLRVDPESHPPNLADWFSQQQPKENLVKRLDALQLAVEGLAGLVKELQRRMEQQAK